MQFQRGKKEKKRVEHFTERKKYNRPSGMRLSRLVEIKWTFS